ncbi:acyl-CoA thioesterase [Bordetella genomosp. 4]|uniref:Thioesterase n=1 Tax=Bordetella genomosp. 4 TaxID=463044 RepID=A0A261U8E8_9BORD|nr:thioesterase family protein [Bordetella genomosp. 4]OZI58204.1 thioesterase [Bordetella genomosp. 4]
MSQELSGPRTLQVGDCHHVELPMRWGDADTLNHMNNTVYFRMMEEARMKMLYGSGMVLPSDQGFILAHASCDFVRSFTYPCDVRVTHKVTRIGRSSLETDLILCKAGDDTGLYAKGRTVMVWIDYGANCSAPLPDEVLRALAAVCVPAERA